MWNVNPRLMCRQHLLGEHNETHAFVGTIKKGIKIDGYIRNELVETHNIKKRHDELAEEMLRRNYKHLSPMEDPEFIPRGVIDSEKSLKLLTERCERCRNLCVKELYSYERSRKILL